MAALGFSSAARGITRREVTAMELQISGGSSGVVAAGFYQSWFAVELPRKNCSSVTISDEVFFGTQAIFSGTLGAT